MNFLKFIVFVLLFKICSLNSIDHTKFVENPRIIFVDIGETLIELSTSKALLNHLGLVDSILNTIHFIFKGKFNLKKANAKEYLNTLKKIPSPFNDPSYEILGFDGTPMPPLQRDSQLGKISLEDCIAIVDKWIEDNPNEFKSETKKRIFKKAFHLNFEAENFVKCHRYTKIIELLKELYCAVDSNNKRLNICFIFSNQPKEVVEQIKIYFPEIFIYSDLQIFSCFEGIIKIQPCVVQKYLALCPNTNQRDVFIIDDEPANAIALNKIKYNNFNISCIHPKIAYSTLKSFTMQ